MKLKFIGVLACSLFLNAGIAHAEDLQSQLAAVAAAEEEGKSRLEAEQQQREAQEQMAYQAEQELHYIYEETKGEAERPSIGAMRSYGEKYGFPIGPDEKVIETAMLYGKTMLAQKKFQHASYFLDIAYKLTENKEIKQVLDGVNEQLAAQH